MEKKTVKIDLHIHSISSGHALNTLDEIRAYATKTGMTHIAITDHGVMYGVIEFYKAC